MAFTVANTLGPIVHCTRILGLDRRFRGDDDLLGEPIDGRVDRNACQDIGKYPRRAGDELPSRCFAGEYRLR